MTKVIAVIAACIAAAIGLHTGYIQEVVADQDLLTVAVTLVAAVGGLAFLVSSQS